ncbi:patatin-like phospholipase family protein [Saccharophagus degradans]|uniref:patatin-like phospholipase family protein n=1 Tax=Saccharophagus degradans TaxID=86304 RepID=UPI002477DC56|nr:patatin-like phospholipase family protein [Saccharophagus degradans]WGO99654.1 patatin-like phospholipase family protein [Saccharophagus degradans]
MSKLDENKQFTAEVLAAEFEEISKRRLNAARADGALPDDRELDPKPTIKNDLVGLACSGGGIRSASFSLGVIQQLICKGLFSKIDYLSTVSGGGYTGSCISALTKDKPGSEKLLTDRIDGAEPEALNHIRNYSEYLNSEGIGSGLRIPVLFIEGVLRSLMTFLPIVILAVFITEVFFEVTGRFSTAMQWGIPILGVTPLVVMLTLRPIIMSRLNWVKRDKWDGWLICTTLLAVASIIAIPLLMVLRNVVAMNASSLKQRLVELVADHIPHVSVFSVLLLGLIIYGIIKLRGKVVVVIASVAAPLSLFALYIFLCVHAIDSPFVQRTELPNANSVSGECSISNDLLQGYSAQDMNVAHSAFCAKKNYGYEKIDLTGMDCSLDSVFTQKHLKFCDYEVTASSADEIVFTHKVDREPPSHFFEGLFTSNKNHILTLSKTNVFVTNDEMLVFEELRLFKGDAEWWLYLLGVAIQVYNWLFMNVNRFSLHPFYRDRLSRTFLISPKNDELQTVDTLKMSELNGCESAAPYHIVNTALNLQGSSNPQLRSRKTVPFILSKRHCGSDLTGYCKTHALEKIDPHFNLATAMAISAAAASPNMGTVGKKSLSFLLTLLNVRLNYWLPHPAKVRDVEAGKPFTRWPLGLSYLMSEALATVNEYKPYVNCSDGGHIENLAVYELLRRQCKTIICIDAEADPNFTFFGLITLQRYAEIDLGICLNIDLSGIKPVDGVSARNYAVGDIVYPNGETGRIIYIKLSFTGSEAEYIHFYRGQNPAFPHQSTSDQFFDETQFEVYRALGHHVGGCATEEIEKILAS